jgi:CHAT domain-containing protein
MTDESLAKHEGWFDKDYLAAHLPEFEATITEARAEGLDPTPVEAARDFLAGRLAVLQGNPPIAEQNFRKSTDAFRKLEMSAERATVAIEAAQAMQSAHRIDSALRFAEEAIAGAELLWWGLSPLERLTTPEIMVYAADVAIPIAHEAHADEKAFDFIQRSKSRRFLEQLEMHFFETLPISAAFAETHGPAPDFDAALQQLDAAWDAYFSGDVVDQRPDAEERVESAYGAEVVRRHRLRPISVPTADARTCRLALGEGEALLELFVTTSETFAALLTRDQLRVVPLGISKKELRYRMCSGYIALASPKPDLVTVEDLYDRMADAEWKEALGGLEGFTFPVPREFLGAMHEILLAPFASALASVRRLVVCPHDVLHSLPFHALESAGGAPLVDTTAITYMPTASAWESLRSHSIERREPATPHVAVLGVERRPAPMQATWFSKKLGTAEVPQEPSEFEDEARAVAATYNVTPLLGPAAKKEELFDAFAAADRIHISCHTVRDRPRTLANGLLLADGLLSLAEISASPRIAAHPGEDVKPAVIMLSACATGIPKVEIGDRLVSLAHELVGRLGCCVVSSLWRADAESTSFLMARLHEHRKTVPDWAEALRLAQRDTMLASSKPEPDRSLVAFRDPYYWAGFFVLGA